MSSNSPSPFLCLLGFPILCGLILPSLCGLFFKTLNCNCWGSISSAPVCVMSLASACWFPNKPHAILHQEWFLLHNWVAGSSQDLSEGLPEMGVFQLGDHHGILWPTHFSKTPLGGKILFLSMSFSAGCVWIWYFWFQFAVIRARESNELLDQDGREGYWQTCQGITGCHPGRCPRNSEGAPGMPGDFPSGCQVGT